MRRNGFTLLEAVIGTGIFAAVTASVCMALIRADVIYGKTREKAIRLTAAAGYFERLSAVPYDSVDSAGDLVVVAVEPGLKLLYLTGESFCLYSLRSSK